MELKELNPEEFGMFRKKLIRKKGDHLQKEFLTIVQNNGDFINYIDKKIKYKNDKVKELSLFPEKLTEAEYKDTPRYVEKLAFSTWNELTPSIACRSSFWGAVTLNHIRNEVIESSYLAVGIGSNQSGLSRINQALKSDEPKSIDDVVRTILRRFSGLPEARGGLRSIYVNCAFGRAWWREKITKEVVEITGGDDESISRTLRKSQEYWEKLVNLLSTSNSVFGDEKIRTGFIWAISDHIDNPKYKKLFTSSGHIDECMDLLGVHSACQEFGVFEPSELKAFMQNEVIEPVFTN